jgi:geranylgeranyl diphosphate synthase type II
MFDLTRYLDTASARINQQLDELLPKSGPSDRVIEAMRYSLMAGGKRLRPVLCLSATEAVDGRSESALSTACAIEMIHTYSLIHDDLPAMDNDRLRRGRPTCHVAFDEATAILAGDALLTSAFEILATAIETSRDPGAAAANMREIAQAAGCMGMIAGQMQDMDTEGRRLTPDQLETLHSLKTGAMIRACLRCGARIGKASAGQMEQLTAYGENLGLAFQVTDDILNVEGDPAKMGKAAGTDRMRNKNAYPALLGIEKSKMMAQRLIDSALGEIEEFGQRGDPLRAIARFVITRKH